MELVAELCGVYDGGARMFRPLCGWGADCGLKLLVTLWASDRIRSWMSLERGSPVARFAWIFVSPPLSRSLEVEHAEAKRISVGGATLHQERENVSKELPNRADERHRLHKWRTNLLDGRGCLA